MAAISPITTEFLRHALRECGLSINAIAKGCGITQPQLHNFHHGKGGLSWEAATRLKKHLGLLPRGGGRDHDERVIINSISSLEEARWFLQQHMEAAMEEDPKVARALRENQKRFLEPAVAHLHKMLEKFYPEEPANRVFRNGKMKSHGTG